MTQEICSRRQELSRYRKKSRQRLLSQNNKLLQALRVELKLNEEHRKLQSKAQVAHPSSAPPCMPRLVAEHHVWASKSGYHMLGLIEDHDDLHKQISCGQRLLAEVDIQTQEALSPTGQKLGPKVPLSVPLSKFLSSMNSARLILEKPQGCRHSSGGSQSPQMASVHFTVSRLEK
ncbi:CDK5 regulatory subunit-associated protein 2 [Lemmus lemmus]